MKALRTLLFAAFGFAILATAPTPTFAQDWPAGQINTQINRMAGNRMDFSDITTTPSRDQGTGHRQWDKFDWGFWSQGVRVCVLRGSKTVYFRFGTATTDNTSVLLTAATQDRMTVPSSTSAAFIQGVSNLLPEPAFPMTGPTSGDAAPVNCITMPWRTRGLVGHVPENYAGSGSGTGTLLATVDVWAW